MSSCCSTPKDGTCSPQTNGLGLCPACGNKGKSVTTLTVKSLVRDHSRVSVSEPFSFCRTLDCDIVYFSSESLFRKLDVKVRVGIKETEDPIPLCYCFNYAREDVRRDIQADGTSKILERIKAEVQGGFCACEVKNPGGSCCLGEVTRTIQQATKAIAALPIPDSDA